MVGVSECAVVQCILVTSVVVVGLVVCGKVDLFVECIGIAVDVVVGVGGVVGAGCLCGF